LRFLFQVCSFIILDGLVEKYPSKLYFNSASKHDNYDDFAFSQFEMDSIYKNYKVSLIEIDSDITFFYKIDDQPEESFLCDSHLIVQKYMRNGKHVSIPISTFTPI
jgi:hypothetical protein